MTHHEKPHRPLMYWIIFTAGLGGMLYGYDIGVISGALLFIKNTIPLSDMQTGLIVGAVLGGGFVANLVTGWFADHFGRRRMIIAASIIFVLGIFAITQSHSFITLFIARLLLGVGVGIVSVAVPLYISEVAPAKIRGVGVTVFQLFLTFGILVAYFVDLLFAPSGNWVGMFMVILLPAVALFFTMLPLPESPRWLLTHGHEHAAEKALMRIHHSAHVEREILHLRKHLSSVTSRFSELFSRKLAKPMFIALFIAASNQLTGINSILQYAPVLIQQSGIQSHSVLMQDTVLIGLIQFVASIVALLLIDKVGRRKLLVTGTAGLVCMDLFLGYVLHADFSATVSNQLQLIGLGLWIAFYAIGPGVVVWLVFSELLPTRLRGRGVAVCLFVNSLCSTVLSSIFLPLITFLGMGNTYWLLGFFTLLYFLVAYFLLPETKGKTLEEIQAFFEHRHTTTAHRLQPAWEVK